MRFSIGIPRVTVQRQMNIRPLLDARSACDPRPSWTVLFLKGYALLSKETPDLRRAISNSRFISSTNIPKACLHRP